jgi:hypothetical protein
VNWKFDSMRKSRSGQWASANIISGLELKEVEDQPQEEIAIAQGPLQGYMEL